ncbi:MAG: TldD/PmbA family protein [Gemmatimonadaceae bacterium]|jgi:TldD protein|nr:TldD/PmbA family protein [Gemmatimonadaceae bacterium]
MTTRRDFLTTTALAAGAVALGVPREARGEAWLDRAYGAPRPAPAMEPNVRELLLHALDEARRAGAAWSDARIQRVQRQSIATRERQVLGVNDEDTIGCGVRVLVEGCWGFAATPRLTRDGIARAAREAVATAKAGRTTRDRAVMLAPAPVVPDGRWSSGFRIDPFTIPIADKVALALAANAAALAVPTVRFAGTQLLFVKEERNYANSEGTVTTQVVVRTWTPMSITAVNADRTDFAVRDAVVQPTGRGWEAVLEARLAENATRWGEQAAEKLTARPVEPGRYDLLLHPSNLGLTIHESVAHPTEIDRAYGYEANYAGTSFVAPPDRVLGALRFGSELMTITGDRSQPGGCATIGWDDDGVAPEQFTIIDKGTFVDYQTTREQANWLDWWYAKRGAPVRSHGCSYADSWSSVAFQRMPNVSLQPAATERSWDDMVAATDRGIAILGRGSYSIDQQRYNAQFGGAIAYEIRGGKITGQLRDVAYVIRTPDFWRSLDLLGGPASYELFATFADGKGQPGQVNAVSHGCPPARFRQATIINTGRKA